MIVIIPYKGKPNQKQIAKGRLADALTDDQRQHLAEAMFVSLLNAFVEFDQSNPSIISKIMVVSRDKDCLKPIRRHLQSQKKNTGITIEHFAEPESCEGLNEALNLVVTSLEKSQGDEAKQCLIMHADLPLVRAEDIASLMNDASLKNQNKKNAKSDIFIIQDKSKTGTNGLVLPIPNPMQLSFGVNSAVAHAKQGLSLSSEGYKVHILQHEQLGFDLDEADDLKALLAYHNAHYFSVENPLNSCLSELNFQ